MSEPWKTKEYRRSLNPDSKEIEAHYYYGVDILVPPDGMIVTRSRALNDPSFTPAVNAVKDANDNRQGEFS